MLDLDAARRLVADFEPPACVIVKHNNPCGVAIGATLAEAHPRRAPATRCRPTAACSPSTGRSTRRWPRRSRELRRGGDRARTTTTGRSRHAAERRRSGSSPERRRAPTGRTRLQAGAGRSADPRARRPARPARAMEAVTQTKPTEDSGTTCSSPGPSAAASAPTRS